MQYATLQPITSYLFAGGEKIYNHIFSKADVKARAILRACIQNESKAAEEEESSHAEDSSISGAPAGTQCDQGAAIRPSAAPQCTWLKTDICGDLPQSELQARLSLPFATSLQHTPHIARVTTVTTRHRCGHPVYCIGEETQCDGSALVLLDLKVFIISCKGKYSPSLWGQQNNGVRIEDEASFGPWSHLDS
ncbi:hypothetical protein EYF80_040745 [Liparis tanakae]|uniref:Uncharacterized protein n=1 Tax=Liparis tanakae TaxID=230148 RepID=A0A4Z2G640_9TELE|nr:hypothetical protein EYF80_040745 [Liparis tanakae]